MKYIQIENIIMGNHIEILIWMLFHTSIWSFSFSVALNTFSRKGLCTNKNAGFESDI